jgi:uncharacterized protein YxjI
MGVIRDGSSIQSGTGGAITLAGHSKLHVKQQHELGEWFGFETRNKYEVSDESGRPVAYAAEQSKGFWGFVVRQFLGHWRTFEIHIFNPARQKVMAARQPFRFFFQRLEVFDGNGQFLGALQQRFSILTKRLDVENARGMVIMEVASPLFKIWTFPFMSNGKQVACITKKWSGVLAEAFTDKDNFLVDFSDPGMSDEERKLVLSAALFIDLRYFEQKASR